MKGKIVNIMRKWWLMALVCTLALSLTSCAKRRNFNLSGAYGFTQCDSGNWQFDVYTVRSQTKAGTYELIIMPVAIDTPGDVATINLANSKPSYKQMTGQVSLYPEEEIYAGEMTNADLNNFPLLLIAPYDPTTNVILQTSGKSAICEIPLPGDGVAQNQQSYYPY